MFFKNKKAEQAALALVALVAVVAVVGLVNMNSGGLTGNVPVKVFDVAQNTVVGEVDAVAGTCKYVGSQNNLICPGTPEANTQLCLEAANTVCSGDSTCILDATQECVNTLGSLDISSAAAGIQSDGTCKISEIWQKKFDAVCDPSSTCKTQTGEGIVKTWSFSTGTQLFRVTLQTPNGASLIQLRWNSQNACVEPQAAAAPFKLVANICGACPT